MLIKRREPWHLPESAATPEAVYRDRRAILRGLGYGSALGAAGLAAPAGAQNWFGQLFGGAGGEAPNPPLDVSWADRFPAERNPDFATLDRAITDESLAASYNNYYEFGSHKRIARAAQELTIEPWTVEIDGLVETPQTLGIDDLFKRVAFEERLYRHRCVEAWSMAVPWTGFPLKRLVEIARPLSGAKYLRMESFERPSEAPGQRQGWYPWPYIEGLTMAEATHDLAFLVTGMYGKPLPKQNGAPLRVHLPWKYGFKSAKGLVRFTFTDRRPVSFWEEVQASEYGFWANVNPEVPHPRWSQATERLLGEDERVPTLLYNGYAEEVAHLYEGLEGERLFV